MKTRYVLAMIAALALCLFASAAAAQSVKERMKARVPTLVELKAQGKVGENNVGLLEYRGGTATLPVVEEENHDRRLVYEAIARKTGTTPTVVGQRRAAQIAQQAPPGTWLESASGQWYQK